MHKLEEYPFMESLNVPPRSATNVEDITDEQERELVLFAARIPPSATRVELKHTSTLKTTRTV